jgi:hypothetical protein
MADEEFPDPSAVNPLNDLFDGLISGAFDVKNLTRIETVITNAIKAAISAGIGTLLSVAGQSGAFIAEQIAEGENQAQPSFNKLAAVAIKDMFGVDAGAELTATRGSGGNAAAADAIGNALLKAFAGQARGSVASGELEPSDEPAKAFLSAMAQLALEGWLEGWIVEALSLGQLETFGDLDDTISHVLGLGRASAAVHGPIVRHMIVTPLEWKLLKAHRPTPLTEALAIRQFNRGKWTGEKTLEELARMGYSEDRIDALMGAQQRYVSTPDMYALVRNGTYDRAFWLAYLRDQGWDAVAAEMEVLAAETVRLNQFQDDSLSAVRAAYVDRRITDAELDTFLPAILPYDLDRDAFTVAARTIRDVNTKRLAPNEARACVLKGVLPIAAYREALALDGYDPDAVLALELLLETELDDKADIAKLRAAKEAEAAATRAAKEATARARAAEAEAAHALARRGSLADLRRAVVRGLVSVDRLAEVLRPQFDPDTVEIYLALVVDERTAYTAQLAAASAAKARAGLRRIDVGALEAAVLNDVLTLGQFRAQLDTLQFTSADADTLTATLQARKADRDAAIAKRAKAEAAAKQRSINLAQFETLVRRGARSIADYNALLGSLDFDEGSRAALIDLLQIHINDDATAAALRAEAEAKLNAKGLSLEQARRGVLLGVAEPADFERVLQGQRFTVDAQAILMAELRADIAEAEAARQRRAEAAGGDTQPAIPLATVARAARLGLVDVDAYRARLAAGGYSDDDIAIEMDLLTTEIADVQNARAIQTAADAAPAAPGLSLAQVAAAVKAGVSHLEDYRARAVAIGLAAADVAILVRVLGDELAATQAAKVRRAEIQSTLKPGEVSIAGLADKVAAGDLTPADYGAALAGLGLDPLDIEILVGLSL